MQTKYGVKRRKWLYDTYDRWLTRRGWRVSRWGASLFKTKAEAREAADRYEHTRVVPVKVP